MPIFEFYCNNCNITIEEIKKHNDLSLPFCEKCNGKMEKIMSLGSFILKGSGWAKDGYSKK